MSKDKLGDRMKSNYENRTKQFLTRRTNTIIRLDGKAFHTYTKGLDKPFDEGLIKDMQETTKFLCENIQGCKAGYTQSDEITLLLTDYTNLQTDAWFDGNVQKITSISAAMATAKFNQLRHIRCCNEVVISEEQPVDHIDLWEKLPVFDSRVFQIPEPEEVVNCFVWRQQDAERNSIQMLAQSLYSHKELHSKNTSVLQDMCFSKGHNWNDLVFYKKRGGLILKNEYWDDELVLDSELGRYNSKYLGNNIDDSLTINDGHGGLIDKKDIKIRTKWEVVDTPIFTQDRSIILNLMK
jgi:tRNA(His) 5'-end guanylyltransferase